jgi:hypothetical protein
MVNSLVLFDYLCNTTAVRSINMSELMNDKYSEAVRRSPSPEQITSPSGEVLATRFDVSDLLEEELGADWQSEFTDLVRTHALPNLRDRSHPSVLEDEANLQVYLYSLPPGLVLDAFPGLEFLYQGYFAAAMQASLPEGAEHFRALIENPEDALEVYAQSSEKSLDVPLEQRMEAHTDEYYTAILVVAAPEKGHGGELVIANQTGSLSKSEVDADATRLSHRSGTLVCFPAGRERSHYADALTEDAGWRIIVGMNYRPVSQSEEASKAIRDYVRRGIQPPSAQ